METVERCEMCDKHDLQKVSNNPDFGYLLVCPNCDSPGGKMPPKSK